MAKKSWLEAITESPLCWALAPRAATIVATGSSAERLD